MELWIRSQDREKLVKVNSIEIQHHYTYKEVVENYMPTNATRYEDMQTRKVSKKDKYIKSVIMCNDEIFLGEYKSEERALEVLDEIQNVLMPKCIINPKSMKLSEPYEENGMILMDCNADARVEQLSTYVYEMPKE